MDAQFLLHLAQAEMIEMLYTTLGDESSRVREQAAQLLCQLSSLNFAYVSPKLRNVTLEVISQLSASKAQRIEEHCAKMLAIMARTVCVASCHFSALFLPPISFYSSVAKVHSLVHESSVGRSPPIGVGD